MLFKLLMLPLIIITKILSNSSFVQISEMLSLVPTRIGEKLRYGYYSQILEKCGDNVRFGIGVRLTKKKLE